MPLGVWFIARLCLWLSLYTFYLLTCQVRVTVGDSGLCCYVPCCSCDICRAPLIPLFAGYCNRLKSSTRASPSATLTMMWPLENGLKSAMMRTC